jgi:glycosyltransferase involved in cell wall biosynthesis
MALSSISHPRIAVFANMGIGGTEKAATIYAVELARRGYPTDYLASEGPRSDYLRANGVRLVQTVRDSAGLLDYLRATRPAVVHQHVPGYPLENRLYPALRALGDARPKVIETNIFGRLEDPASEPLIDFRCFISAASAAQALYRARLPVTEQFFDRQTVLYYPLVSSPVVDAEAARKLRSELRVADDNLLAVRIGRPGHKWARWECAAFQRARHDAPNLCLLLMEPPEPIWSDVANSQYGPGFILRRETRDFEWLKCLYAASDLTIHSSDWGESFGYTIAEGMAAGHPVITRSTPWGDNAQVELVENGVTGYVCWSIPEMGRRLGELAKNPERRRTMGAASRQRIERLTTVGLEIDLLEEIISFCLMGSVGEKMIARAEKAFGFVQSFPQRERATSEAAKDLTLDSALASLYGFYRCTRSDARALLNRAKRK